MNYYFVSYVYEGPQQRLSVMNAVYKGSLMEWLTKATETSRIIFYKEITKREY